MKARKLSNKEIGAILKCKDILSKIGCESSLNIKELTNIIGVSRKSAYEYKKENEETASTVAVISHENVVEENRILKEHVKRIELENQGLRIAKMAVEELKKKGY